MNFFSRLTSNILYYVYCLWCKTLRYTESGREVVDAMNEAKELMVFCLWHNEVLPVMYAKRNLRIVAIVSPSKDGEYIAQLLENLGMKSARGSSSREGIKATLLTTKIMQEERCNACITVDGPRGPRHIPKKGALFLAHQENAYVVPMRIFMKRAKIFRSWDRFRLPLPFSRVHITFDTPYKLEEGPLNAEKAVQELQGRLQNITPPEAGFLDDSV